MHQSMEINEKHILKFENYVLIIPLNGLQETKMKAFLSICLNAWKDSGHHYPYNGKWKHIEIEYKTIFSYLYKYFIKFP